MDERYLVVGLGNPGPHYAHNRHNVGFMVLDLLAARIGAKFAWHRRTRNDVLDTRIADTPVTLAKPRLYMNESGGPVKAICEFLRKQGTAAYEEVVLPMDDAQSGDAHAAERDDVYWDAVHLVIGQRQASISFLQRRLRLGYPKAARFVDMMEQDRIIGPGEGAKPREVLVGPEYLAKRGK